MEAQRPLADTWLLGQKWSEWDLFGETEKDLKDCRLSAMVLDLRSVK